MLGAYFQCYKEPRATYESLKAFRASYPTSTIVLLSDNGFDYTEMAKEFGCKYIHSTDNFHVSMSTSRYAEFQTAMARFVGALMHIPEPYAMLLEDDVKVFRPYTEPFLGTINGNTVNYIYSPNAFDLIPWSKFKGRSKYTGHGGSVYDKKALLNALSHTAEINWLVANWSTTLNLCPHRIDLDIFLSVLILSLGGSIHHLEQHKDMLTNGIGRDGADGVCVVHQWKEFYGQQLN
jgi:hypothetical protein